MSNYITHKKFTILHDNIFNFIKTLKKLNEVYHNKNVTDKYKYICLTERWATVSLTQFQCWTTRNNSLRYKAQINDRLSRDIKKIHEDLKYFIKDQRDVNGMMYYTYELLNITDILNRNDFMKKYLDLYDRECYIHEDVIEVLQNSKESYLHKEVTLEQFKIIRNLMEIDLVYYDEWYESYNILIDGYRAGAEILDKICIKKISKDFI